MKTKRIFWNKLRILVTNKCNYRCPFCHNEGQSKEGKIDMMHLQEFSKLVDYLENEDISELHFSGGEPFLNPELVEMINYVDKNTTWGIGCATNLSKISDEQILELSSTRVKFNIQFPYANNDKFHSSTGNGDYAHILNRIQAVKQAGIPIGLNAVVQNENITEVKELLFFAIENEVPLKLLPQIGLNGSDKYNEHIYPLLNQYAIEQHDKGTGAHRWVVEKDGKTTSVLYINAPCFNKDINVCREFGELRIHPDMSLQPCILKDKTFELNMQDNKEKTIQLMTDLWNDFNHC